MFKFDLEIPTYAEWKVQLDKLMKEQPEQAKKYQEQVQKFWQEFFEDTFKIKKQFRYTKKKQKKKRQLLFQEYSQRLEPTETIWLQTLKNQIVKNQFNMAS